MSDDVQLARDLGVAAAEMRADGHRYAGGITRAAQRFMALAMQQDPDPPPSEACRRCATPIVQKPTGRPRLYCSDRCRKGRRTKPAETRPS
jgi:hypothetical protein